MDTTPEVEAIQFAFYRSAPAWKKMELASQLNQMARTLALSGLRQRHPVATDAQLQRYLADMLLGPELAERAYGPHEQEEQARQWLNLLRLRSPCW